MNNCNFNIKDGKIYISNGLFSASFGGVDTATMCMENAKGLSVPFTRIDTDGSAGKKSYCVWDDLPVVYLKDGINTPIITLEGQHWRATSIKLHAFTDDNDTITEVNEYNLFKRMLFFNLCGEIFFFEDALSERAVVIISEHPDYVSAKVTLKGGVISIENDNCPIALGFCNIGECEALCREYYRHARKSITPITMSNTWGDGNGFSRVCRDFVLKEMDAGSEIGVDIVQIDDGWQCGSTADLTRRDANGRRSFHGDFWELDTEKFPNGMKEVADYAAAYGIKTGLWFAPHSHNNFELLERDIAVLKKAYDEWGIRFFKLDMYWVNNEAEKNSVLKLFDAIYSFGDDVYIQCDVTRNERMNYLCGRQYGTVFVENRYTKLATYYPHRVLRNLWNISRYIPSFKFQFELINPDLNSERYYDYDIFAPIHYDMDYLFASVMMANPLIWMEMQFLSDERKAELGRIMNVWKEHREALANSDIIPIGECPSGRSISGFIAKKDGRVKYLLMFREVSKKDSATVELACDAANVKILASNTESSVNIINGIAHITFGKERAYIFAEICE